MGEQTCIQILCQIMEGRGEGGGGVEASQGPDPSIMWTLEVMALRQMKLKGVSLLFQS